MPPRLEFRAYSDRTDPPTLLRSFPRKRAQIAASHGFATGSPSPRAGVIAQGRASGLAGRGQGWWAHEVANRLSCPSRALLNSVHDLAGRQTCTILPLNLIFGKRGCRKRGDRRASSILRSRHGQAVADGPGQAWSSLSEHRRREVPQSRPRRTNTQRRRQWRTGTLSACAEARWQTSRLDRRHNIIACRQLHCECDCNDPCL